MSAYNPDTLNLIPAIRSIEEQIRVIENEHRKKIAPYQRSLDELRKINTACEKCNGTGRYLRSRAYAEDDRPDPDDPNDWRICSDCKGSGRA